MGYADAPDGEECFHKIWRVSRTAGITSLAASVIVNTHRSDLPKTGYMSLIATHMKVVLPAVAAGATFAAVTCTACNLRGKDDKTNYFMGGLSAGGVIGVARKSIQVGVPCAVFLGLAAIIFKDHLQNGWEPFPYTQQVKWGYDFNEWDYTKKQ